MSKKSFYRIARLTLSQRFVYLHIEYVVNTTKGGKRWGECTETTETISKRVNLSEKTVKKAIKFLSEKNYISIEHFRRNFSKRRTIKINYK